MRLFGQTGRLPLQIFNYSGIPPTFTGSVDATSYSFKNIKMLKIIKTFRVSYVLGNRKHRAIIVMFIHFPVSKWFSPFW